MHQKQGDDLPCASAAAGELSVVESFVSFCFASFFHSAFLSHFRMWWVTNLESWICRRQLTLSPLAGGQEGE